MPKRKRQRCFVIMPFSETSPKHTKRYWTKHYSSFLKVLIEEQLNLEAHRSQPLRGDIVNQIIKDLLVCQVVVADLTDSNPNVYWELGVRQSFKHGTVTIAEEGTILPSDIGAKGTLFYSDDHLKNAEFCEQFREALNDCLAYPERPDSRVLELVSGRGTLFEIFRRDEATRRLDALISECNDNSNLFKRVIDRAQMNQENPEEAVFTTDCFRTSAIELLITNRYIDKEQTFYKSAEKYLVRILALNGRIVDWPQRRESIEVWFLGIHDSTTKLLNSFRVKVLAARDELTQTL